jgi:hypothetical protein
MNNDSYKIVISLSHHRISFEYWLRDGEDRLLPMPMGTWPSPLAFYCSQTGIKIGEEAARAAQSGTANAFDNYFERLSGGETYQYGGQNKQIGNLLLDAAEMVFRDFYCNVLFNRYGSIAENRANMPLTLVCEADIEPNEKAYLTSLFKDSGYGRIRVVDLDTYIERYIDECLSKEFTCDDVLVAWSEGVDLRLRIWGVSDKSLRRYIILKGLGKDPRLGYVIDMIWSDVVGQNSWLSREVELPSIEKAASDFLNSKVSMISDKLTLSDGRDYKYRLNRTTVDYIQSEDSQSVKAGLETFLREVGLTTRSKTLLVLRGIAAGNSYFEQNLSHGFLRTICSDSKLRNKVMGLLIHEQVPELPSIDQPVSPTNLSTQVLSKELRKKWRSIKAEIKGKDKDVAVSILEDFWTDSLSVSGDEDLKLEYKTLIEGLNPNLDSQSVIQKITEAPERVKSLERKWREVKATSKAKVRSKNYKEADHVLAMFISECHDVAGTENLINRVEAERKFIPQGENLKTLDDSSLIPKNKGTDKCSAHSNLRTKDSSVGPYRKDNKEENKKNQSVDKGRELISQNRIKEARDWYRENGNSQRTKILTEILRSQKSVESRKRTVDEYRKNKNIDQVNRIINELKEYVDLCDKVDLSAVDYKKLLIEYQKLL